jgi:cytochrome P450
LRADPFTPPPPEPPHFDEAQNAWVLSRYADVLEALQNPHLWPDGAEDEAARGIRDGTGRLRVRGEMLEAFSPARISAWMQRLEPLAREAVSQLPAGSPVDLLADFARPWALSLAILVMGVDAAQRPCLAELAAQVSAGTGEPDGSPQQLAAAKASSELERLLQGVSIPMREPTFVAISQTFTRFLAKAWFDLIRHPDQWKRLHEDPGLLPAAMEELLRHAGIVRKVVRRAVADTEAGGLRIQKSQRVFLMVDSANYDPAQFPDPGRLDIARQASGQVGLGGGRSACVGSLLIRTAGGTLTSALVRRFTRAELAGEPQWHVSSRIAWPQALRTVLHS